MICNKCGKTINDGAKFCKFCGASVQSAPQTVAASKAEITCPSCGKTLSAGAKFCKFCGISLNASPVETNQEAAPDSSMKNDRNIDQITNFVTWHIMPEQIAVKIDEKEIAAYKTIKGVYVTPGTKALFFVNGKYAASLDSGTYSFKDFVNESPSNAPTTTKPHPVLDFFKKIANHIANGVSALFGRQRSATRDDVGLKTIFTVILVRGVEFPLVYDFKQVATQNIRSDVGLHMLCKITNLNDFFEAQLVDKKMVTNKPKTKDAATMITKPNGLSANGIPIEATFIP